MANVDHVGMTVLELTADANEPLATPVASAHRPEPVSAEVSVIRSLQGELDTYYAQMRAFQRDDVTEVFMALAAFTARASEVRGYLSRQSSKRIDSFRTRELDPFIDECDRQFRVWSRMQSVRQLEADLTGKGF